MSSSLGDLIVRIGADVTDLQAGFASVNGLLETSAATWASAGAVLSAFVTAPLVGLGYAAFSAGEAFDAASKSIEEKTGATGAALDSLNKSFEAVFTSVPVSAGAATTAITQLNQALGLTGEPLTALATQVVSLNRMLGETAPSAQAVAQMFNQWNVAASDQSKVLDELFVAYQKTGTSIASMTEQLATFGPQLKGMGFDLTTSIAILAQFGQAGVNTSAVIRGLNTALANFAKQGVADPAAALADLIQKIKDAGTTTEATGLIVKDFGARAATQFATAVRDGRLDVDQLVQSLQNAGGSITATEQKTRTLGDAWTLFKNQLDDALKPLGSELVQGLESASKSGTGLIGVVKEITTWFTGLSGTTQLVIVGVVGLAAAIGPLLIVTAGALAAFTALMPLFLAMATTAGTVAFAISTGLVPALTGAELVLARLVMAVPLVAAAFAGWGLGQWLQSFTTEYKGAEDAVNKLAVALQAQGVELDRGGASLKSWAAQVFAAQDSAQALQKEIDGYNATLTANGVTIEQGSMTLQTYRDTLKSLAAAYDPVKDAANAAAAAQETEAQKLKEYTAWVNAENAAIAEELKYRTQQYEAWTKLHDLTEQALQSDQNYYQGLIVLKNALSDTGVTIVNLDEEAYKLNQEFVNSGSATNEYTDSLGTLNPALDSTSRLMQDVQNAGIQNASALKQSSDAAYDLWQQMLNTTDAEGKQIFTVGELGQAYLDYVQAQKQADLAMGTWTADNEAALKSTQDAVNGTFSSMTTAQKEWAKESTQLLNDFNKGVADAIFGKGSFVDEMEQALTKMGESVTEFILTKLEHGLWDALRSGAADGGPLSGLEAAFKGMFEKIGGWLSSLGSSIAGVLSGAGAGAGEAAGTAVDLSSYYKTIQGTGAAGQAAGAAGQAAGGAGQAAGSALSTIGSIANIAGLGVSIASGIVSGIQQAHANNLLAEIEESTRYTKGYMLGLLGQGWAVIDQLNRIIFLDLEQYIKPAIDAVNDTVANLYNRISDIAFNYLIPDIHSMSLALATSGGSVPVVNNQISIYLGDQEVTDLVMSKVTSTLQQQGGKL